MLKRVVIAIALAVTVSREGRGQVPLGDEILVNQITSGHQRRPKIGVDASGAFVIVWAVEYSAASGVFGRRFDASGSPSGVQFDVNTANGHWHGRPSLAMAADGTFVVAWRDAVPYPSAVDDIFLRRFDPGAGPLGAPLLVSVPTAGAQRRLSVTGTPDGRFTVVWEERSVSAGVFAQHFEASGATSGARFQVNTSTTLAAWSPAAAYDSQGNLVVAWHEESDGDSEAAVFRQFDGAGVALGGVERANTYTTGRQNSPSVAASPDGGFLVAWHSEPQDGSQTGLYAQRYDSSADRLGAEFVINSYTTLGQYHPSVAFDASGRFVVAWSSRSPADDGFYSVRAQLFDRTGAREGAEFRVNSVVPGVNAYPAAAFQPDGSFVVAWQGYKGAAGGYDILAQRFAPDLIFRDDFEAWAVFPWSDAAADGADLRRSMEAALNGSALGLHAEVDDTAPLYLQDDSPNDERRYRARFYFDPSGFDPGEAEAHFRVRLFLAFADAPARRVAAVVLKRRGGAYSVIGRARRDDDSQVDLGFFPVSAGPHAVEIDLTAASGPDANDGRFALWIDGTLMGTREGLDNSQSGVDFVRLGVLSAKAGAVGNLYLDDFESRRLNYIGL